MPPERSALSKVMVSYADATVIAESKLPTPVGFVEVTRIVFADRENPNTEKAIVSKVLSICEF